MELAGESIRVPMLPGYLQILFVSKMILLAGASTAPADAPDSTDGLAEIDTLRLTGTYDDALKQLDAVLQAGTVNDAWHVARAKVLIEVGQYTEAIKAVRQAGKLNPRNTTARRLLGELYEIIGDKDKAIQTYAWFDKLLQRSFPAKASSLTDAGIAIHRHAVLTHHADLVRRTRYVLQDLLQIAYERVDPQYWPARLAAADLLLSKYNLIDARQDYEAVLKINDKLADAHVGLGYIALAKWEFEEAENQIATAIEINPYSTAAHRLRARLHLTERKFAQAADAAEEAIETNPNDIEALALLAAARLRDGDRAGSTAAIDRAKRVNPHSPIVPATLGEWLAAGRQYVDAEEYFKQAIVLAPEWPDPQTALGLMYMQSGNERAARRILQASWKLDPYNAKTKHTLDLLDQLERFSRDETEHFIIKSDDERDAAVRPYIAAYLESIYSEIVADFGGPPPRKTIVELFPDHRSFAVRITGNPWIHTIGACTGPVIAMDAPRPDASPHRFNWAAVLRHEFVHTVSLTATGNRIPHWLTEGLACWAEQAPRRWQMCQLLAMAIRSGRLFDLQTIDWGFARPKRPTDRTLAYAQSEWMVEYLVGRFGSDVIDRMLDGFRDRKTQPQVLEQVIGMTPTAFMSGFKPWAAEQAEAWRLPMSPILPVEAIEKQLADADKKTSAVLRAELAEAHLIDHEFDKAEKAVDKAIEANADHPNVLRVFLTVKTLAIAKEHDETKRPALLDKLSRRAKRLAERQPDSGVAAGILGVVAMNNEDFDQAIEQFNHLKRIWPADPTPYRQLMKIHLERDEHDKALPEMVELARLEPDDLTVVMKIADIYSARNQHADAARWLRRAIEIDPYSVRVHRRLGEWMMRENRFAEAINEFDVLVRIEPGEPANHSQLAFALHRAGKTQEAKAAAKRAVTLDPDNEAQKLLD